MERETGQLSEQLADAGLFARDPARFNAASERLASAEAELAAAEEQWLELELLREEVEGSDR
ncbi:MAG: hypothetical protein AB7G35_23400 [Hyphomicrobiaceae bacterium]